MSTNPNVDFSDSVDDDAALVDLSGVPDQAGFECMPRGVYDVLVDEVQYGQSQRSGNNMWTWVFAIESGDYANRKLFFHTPFVESTMPRVKKVLSILAPELLSTPFNPQKLADEGFFVGKRARARVDVKRYEGVMRNNVRDILAPGEEGAGAFM